MGCFDEITIRCPKCGYHVLEQSKAGDCTMSMYRLEEAPTAILADLDDKQIQCSDCGYILHIHVLKPQVIVT